MLKFNGKTIPGSTESLIKGSPELSSMRRGRYWDIVGEYEVMGEQGGRQIVVTHILHDGFANHTQLKAAIQALEKLVGQNGTLTHTGTAQGDPFADTFKDVTFEAFQPIPLAGQEFPTELKDISGTLFNDSGNADNGWFQYVIMSFRQLIV